MGGFISYLVPEIWVFKKLQHDATTTTTVTVKIVIWSGFICSIFFSKELSVYKVSFDIAWVTVDLRNFLFILTSEPQVMSLILPLLPKFHQKFKDSEPNFYAIYISLNADTVYVWNQERCQKWSTAFFPLLVTFLCKNWKFFMYTSFPFKIMSDPLPAHHLWEVIPR